MVVLYQRGTRVSDRKVHSAPVPQEQEQRQLGSGTSLTRTFLSTAESGDAAKAAVTRLRKAHHAPSFFTMVEDKLEAHEDPKELPKLEKLCLVVAGLTRMVSTVRLNLSISPIPAPG